MPHVLITKSIFYSNRKLKMFQKKKKYQIQRITVMNLMRKWNKREKKVKGGGRQRRKGGGAKFLKPKFKRPIFIWLIGVKFLKTKNTDLIRIDYHFHYFFFFFKSKLVITRTSAETNYSENLDCNHRFFFFFLSSFPTTRCTVRLLSTVLLSLIQVFGRNLMLLTHIMAPPPLLTSYK